MYGSMDGPHKYQGRRAPWQMGVEEGLEVAVALNPPWE